MNGVFLKIKADIDFSLPNFYNPVRDNNKTIRISVEI